MSAPLLRHPLHKIDLKLLTCLDALLAHRQVSRAARALDMDQPAMSSALARLRELLDDPLFTRVGQGMAPTPRALSVAPAVRQILEEAGRLLAAVDSSPDGRLEGSFRLMVGADFIAELVLPVLAGALERHMPALEVVATPPNPQRILDDYANGKYRPGRGLPAQAPARARAPAAVPRALGRHQPPPPPAVSRTAWTRSGSRRRCTCRSRPPAPATTCAWRTAPSRSSGCSAASA
jgi:DNA-binding transcriptional LysR family regulator